MLYCGSSAGCAHVTHDLSFEEDLCLLNCPFHAADKCFPNGPVAGKDGLAAAASPSVVRVDGSQPRALSTVAAGIIGGTVLATMLVVGILFRSAAKSRARKTDPALRAQLRPATSSEANVV